MTTLEAPAATCGVCGVPVNADGTPALERMAARQAEVDRAVGWTRAQREELAGAQTRLTRAQAELALAEERNDVYGRTRALQRLDSLEGRIATLEKELSSPRPDSPEDGVCDGCGAIFRHGRVDMRAMEAQAAQTLKTTDWLRALEEELHATKAGLLRENTQAEKATLKGDEHAALTARQRAQSFEKRVSNVEQAIAHARGQLTANARPPAARAERRTNARR